MSSDYQDDAGGGELRVRMASAADAEAFVRFNCAMALETENKTLDERIVGPGVRAVFENPTRGFYVVAESAGRIAAALMVTFEWSDWRNGTFWWIQSVYVKPEFRGAGAFKALYEAAAEQARCAEGVCGFRLYVERENVRAQKAYAGLGLEETPYRMYEQLF